jgi:hypothetical protein
VGDPPWEARELLLARAEAEAVAEPLADLLAPPVRVELPEVVCVAVLDTVVEGDSLEVMEGVSERDWEAEEEWGRCGCRVRM